MPRYDFSLEDDATILTVAQAEFPDEDTACDCAVQLLSALFARMHEDAPDWSSCRIRVLAASGEEILASSVGQAALLERDQVRDEAAVRTDH